MTILPAHPVPCKKLTRRRIFRWLQWPALLLIAGLLPCAVSAGEVVYRVGFEETEDFGGSYTAGPLIGQGERAPAVTPWLPAEEGAFPGADVVQESNTSHLPPPQGKQMLQIRYETGNPGVLQNFLTESKAIKQDVKVAFSLAVDAGVSNGTFTFAFQSSSGLNSGAWFGIRKISTEDDRFGFFYKKTNAEGKIEWEKIGDATFEPHQFYKIGLQVDYQNQTYDVHVSDAEGKETLTVSGLPLLDQDGHMSAGRGFNRIYIGADQIGTKPLFLVDDIAVELMP